MSQTFNVNIEVNVFDEKLLIAKAIEHANRPGSPCAGTEIESAEEALTMLLDPAGGGDAYTGDVEAAGFQVVETTVSSEMNLAFRL